MHEKNPNSLKITEKIQGLVHKFRSRTVNIQTIIMFNYAIMALIVMTMMGFSFYFQFTRQSKLNITAAAQQTISQTELGLDNYLIGMRNISDAVYYNVIKNTDIGNESLDSQFNLLYESNRDDIISIALFKEDGTLISASPISLLKEGVDVRNQEWFQEANQDIANIHFSSPHVQNLFDDPTGRYNWVISLSVSVEITENGIPGRGVLLVDMNYASINQMLGDINDESNQEYMYLIDNMGKIIYHPRQMLINAGIEKENNMDMVLLEDGVHDYKKDGNAMRIVVGSVSYTGWKLITVIPNNRFSFSFNETRYFMFAVFLVSVLAMLLFNSFISQKITKPIRNLDDSVKRMDNGMKGNVDVDPHASKEVKHLGMAIQSYKEKNDQLMKDIVREQQEQRRSELDALQSQINPHFLYNTLDSIVWMIEKGDKNKEAVFMVTQLASLFRVSLSKGKTIISIEDELKHVNNYLNIQSVRFNRSFETVWDVPEELNKYCTVKLILQPIVENSINYGIRNMEEEGIIEIKGRKVGEDIYLSVSDNGIGIPEEDLEQLLDETVDHKHVQGSGVGIINIQKRIQLRFGEEYGLTIDSEPDEGTCVTIHIPAVPYTKENCEKLEGGTYHEKA